MFLYLDKIHPIIIPQQCFHDVFDKDNAFLDMNPSVHIDDEGNTIILVRSVNYRKFHNKLFTMYDKQSHSKYTILEGKLKGSDPLDLNNFTVKPLNWSYDRPTYPTYWIGVEDVRFINAKSILAIVPECNPGGQPSVFRASLKDTTLHTFIDCKPNVVEKNWMPFTDASGEQKVIYSLQPFRVKSVDSDTFTDYAFTGLDGWHGSTNGIPYRDSEAFLFLIHLNKERTYHKWLLFYPEKKITIVSAEFTFFKHAYIEFPTSLQQYKNRIFISLGVNDDKAFIVETNPKAVSECFAEGMVHRCKTD
jgi:hypothetical protein